MVAAPVNDGMPANQQYKATTRLNTENCTDDPPPKISQDHYRHIHEQRDFIIENLSLAGYTDIVDSDDIHVQYEYEFQLDDDLVKLNREINEAAGEDKSPKIEIRFRMPEVMRLQRRVKNRFSYIGGMPLALCQVE